LAERTPTPQQQPAQQQTTQQTALPGPALRLVQLYKTHQKRIFLGLAIVIAAGLAVWGYSLYRQRVEGQAWAAYESILLGLDAKWNPSDEASRNKIIGQLEELVKSHAGTEAALHSHLELGWLLYRAKNYQAASEHYRAALGQLKPDDPLQPVLAQALGECAEAQGQYDQAAEWYRQTAASPQLKTSGLWNLARVYELAGRKEEARQTYQQLLQEKPDAEHVSQVYDRLIRLGK